MIALGGYHGASMAVRAGGQGDVTTSRRLWHKPEDIGWLGTGVVDNGAIYICDMGGVIDCIDVATGKEIWKDRGMWGTWSSITQTADGLLYLMTKSGTTTVFRPSREGLRQVAENQLDETTNASVVIAGDDVIIRTDAALWCFTSTQ